MGVWEAHADYTADDRSPNNASVTRISTLIAGDALWLHTLPQS